MTKKSSKNKTSQRGYVKTEKIDTLMLHYMRWRQDMDTRRTRKNGWNDIVSAYMGKLPANWPFLSVVTDPRIRTTILEKTARLLNAKLQGTLVPREGGDVVKAKINNAILSYQWDCANEGGSMLEKIALIDQTCRLFGAGFAQIYWNTKKNTNELKPIDQRDIGFDGAATHVRNARWVQIREFTTFDKLEERGYDVSKLKEMIKEGEVSNQWRSSSYESIVKANRGLEDRVGEYDDPENPILEVVTEWTPKTMTIFLPRLAVILEDGPNPYKHGKIPVAQLRYYPLGDDIYGESEVESVLPLQRAINAILCGFIDEMNFSMRPPLKISSSGVRIETIEYGPGAQWIMQSPNLVEEMRFSPQTIANFNATYPALVAAFNTAMGDQSQAISVNRAAFKEKTATEVINQQQQANTRDQYNQMYLAEFLKDVMMMWLSNNKQYLFDDPTKKYIIYKIVGKDNIQEFEQLNLADKDIPNSVMNEIANIVVQNPEAVDEGMLNQLLKDVAIPKHAVILNPDEKDPSKFQIKPKFEIDETGEQGNLYVTPEDFEGTYDYIPDVRSMSQGALQQMQLAKQQAIQLALNPEVVQLLAQQGKAIKVDQLIVNNLEDQGMKDAESLIVPLPQSNQTMPQMSQGQMPYGQQPNGTRPTTPQESQGVNLTAPVRGLQGIRAAQTFGASL